MYVPSGWKHYARGRKTLRRTFVSWGKMVVFFDRREKKQFFQGKQMFFSEFFCPRHNVFQPEGYIFLVFHPLTYHKPLHFDGFWFCIISWPIGRPPAERRGGQGGDPPAKAKRRLLKYLKKGNYNLVATNWVGPKQQKITKNNRFEKLLISKISNYRKHYISKTTTNEENSNFQKTTNFEQEAW